ncbi:MAG: hypothetical protein L3J26_01200 [Candidatus Polarisedimenticolaceae bacterium]|nr:hypothetical protein [Candidatus Polarisedimenticolaceae bacterium]
MSLYTSVISNLVFPLHEKLKRHSTVSVRKQMEETQWWTQEQLKSLQLERLQKLITSTYNHVPYYRKVLQELELKPADFTTLEDLQKLPLLTKDLIRAHTEELKADNAQGLARFNTGGSTGEPLIFFIGKERVSHDVAAKWRATRWWDVDIGDPEIVVWGSPIELGSQDRVRKIRDQMLRTKLISAFEMSVKNLDRFIEEIRSFSPKMLFGYPSSLSLIARHAQKQGVCLDKLNIKVAFVTSERLYDDQRKDIEETFGCPVANGYGGRDAGFIAHQCPEGGMHITAEDVIVEIVDKNGNTQQSGEAGEVVITHLATQEFPFIRYRTGDVAVLDDQACSCGRGLPLLKDIQGRTTDFIIAADGTAMHGLALIYVIRDLEGVSDFKIIQQSLSVIDVQIVPDNQYQNGVEEAIRQGFKKRLGQGVTINVEKVDQIASEKSGKYRYVMSKVLVQ